MDPKKVARGLGWFSIGLGLAEIAATKPLSRLIGVQRNHTTLMRLFGLREIAAGIGILASEDPTPWVWGRVAGDALDVAALTAALGEDGSRPGRIATTMAVVSPIVLLDIVCARQLSVR